MTERETGEFIATQKAMVQRLAAIEKSVSMLDKKVSIGKGFLAGLAVASGGGWAVVTNIIAKAAGGS